MPSLRLSSPAQSRAMQPVQEGAACAWCSPCEAKTDAGAVPLPLRQTELGHVTATASTCQPTSRHVLRG